MYVVCAHGCEHLLKPKEDVGAQEVEFQTVASHPTNMLGTKLRDPLEATACNFV